MPATDKPAGIFYSLRRVTGIAARVLLLIGAFCITAGLVVESLATLDLWGFEIRYIGMMLGIRGICLVLFLNAGLLLLAWNCFRYKSILTPSSVYSKVFLGLWLAMMLWFMDWMFLADPFTLRVRSALTEDIHSSDYHPRNDVRALAAFNPDGTLAFPDRLGIMLDRIVVNNPYLYAQNGFANTILKYSDRYKVDPILIFYLDYIDSWYGKAPAGPMPFFDRMTATTFRKLVQVHLPAFIVESPLRIYLASSNLYERLLGKTFTAWQLREFAQKFTLDASVLTAVNIFSDALLVMKEYPGEFPELSASATADPLSRALRDAYTRIAQSTLRKPYEEPYAHDKHSANYYNSYRQDLKKFARAVFYKLIFDFDFGTRVQALRIKYDEKILRDAVGLEAWRAIDKKQKLSMDAMSRDMFMPNVGKLGDNLYTLCELNCTPIAFVAEEAKRNLEAVATSRTIWRPSDSEKLYGGANFRLRVFSEVWQAFYGIPLPGINPTNTVEEAITIVR